MTCFNCRNYFCWLCAQRITGYEHFNPPSKCQLWEKDETLLPRLNLDIDIEEEEKRLFEKGIKEYSNLMKCPQCFEINVKKGECNLINCSKCQVSFCYMCGRLISNDEDHYAVTNCYFMTKELTDI